MPPRARRAERPLAERSAVAAARVPATCAATGAGVQAGTRTVCVPIRGARRRAPRQPADCPGGRAARPRAPSSPSIAVGQRARSRPRRGSVAAVLPHWSHDDGRLPEGRLIRPRPPPAEGHGREAWCQQRSGTAGGRWEPRLPGQPASPLAPHALVWTALASSNADRPGAAFGYETRTNTLRQTALGQAGQSPRQRSAPIRRFGGKHQLVLVPPSPELEASATKASALGWYWGGWCVLVL